MAIYSDQCPIEDALVVQSVNVLMKLCTPTEDHADVGGSIIEVAYSASGVNVVDVEGVKPVTS